MQYLKKALFENLNQFQQKKERKMKKLLLFVCVFFVMLIFSSGNVNSEEGRSWYLAISTGESVKREMPPDPENMIKKFVFPSGLIIIRYIDKDNCVGISFIGQKGDRDICEIISYPYGSGVRQSYSSKTKFKKLSKKNKHPGEIITYKNGTKVKREIIEHPDGKIVIRLTNMKRFDIDETILYPYNSPPVERGIDEDGTIVDWDINGHGARTRRITYPNGESLATIGLGDGLIIRKREVFDRANKKDYSVVPYLTPEPYPQYARGVADMGYWSEPPFRKGYGFVIDLNHPPEALPEQTTSITGEVITEIKPKPRTKYYLVKVERVNYNQDLYYSIDKIKELNWKYKVFDRGYPNDKEKDYLASFDIKLRITPSCGTAEYAFFILDEGHKKELDNFKGRRTNEVPAAKFELYNIREKSLDGTNWHQFTHKCDASLRVL